MACSLPGFSVHGIFQVLNLGLPHCRQMLYRLSHQGSPEDSQRERKMKERERETFPAKSSNLRRCPARSQHKGLREYQRRASRLQTGPAHPSPEAGRQAANSQSQRERGKLGPGVGIFYQTASRLPVAKQVFLGSWTVAIQREGCCQRSCPQRRHTARLRQRSRCAQRKPNGWDGEVIRCTAHLGSVHWPSTWSPELLGPGKGTKRRPDRVCAFVEYPRT